MTTYGLSYNRGVFYYSPSQGVAHATYREGQIRTHYFPWGLRGILFLLMRLVTTLPFGMTMTGILLAVWLLEPDLLEWWLPSGSHLPYLPDYSLVLYAFACHFFFPMQLRQYHGAEHKVFSYRFEITLSDLSTIARANVINRGCSTNAVVTFFLGFLPSVVWLDGWYAIGVGVLAMLLVPRLWRWGDRRIVFPISAWLQRYVTTATPEERHLRVAILSYMSLQAGRAVTEQEKPSGTPT